MAILVVVEHDQQQINPNTESLITAAKKLNDDIHCLVMSGEGTHLSQAVAHIEGVKKVLNAVSPQYQHLLAEEIAAQVIAIGNSYSHILAPATTFGKNFLPRVAAKLDVAQLSDVIEIISTDTFKRPIYAGNAIATVKSLDPIKVMTVRTIAFTAAEKASGSAPIETISATATEKSSTFVSLQAEHSERPDLSSARVVVSGGRGLQSGENFKLIEALADKLNAAIGASRAAVDAGFIANDHQVGQTGKVVAPELYIAVGISGAIQHLAGMKDSKVIVAINKDEDAPIFQVADYGIVGDLFTIVPKLTELL